MQSGIGRADKAKMKELMFIIGVIMFCAVIVAVVHSWAAEIQHKHDENKDDCDP